MNKENTKQLIERCPKLFGSIAEEAENKKQGRRYGPIAFGFECGDGWFNIILEAAEKIEAEINTLPKEQQNNFKAAQVKEKFGTLRFYMHGETEAMSEAIRIAEEKSYQTCEGCGKPSITLGRGWIVNQCRDCYIEYASDRYGEIPLKAGIAWDKAKKRKERRILAINRLNAIRTKKGLSLYGE